MKITSSAFEPGGSVPERFSQNGENRSPPLSFSETPDSTHSLALIVDDPDAPRGTFTHLVAFNIDPRCTEFQEGGIPSGVRLGLNDYQQPAYAGPKPPSGEHRYFFRLFALDHPIELPQGATRAEVESAMSGHIIAQAELMGRYSKPASTQ